MPRILVLLAFTLISSLCCGEEALQIAEGLVVDVASVEAHALTIKQEKVESFGGVEAIVGRVNGRLAYFVSAVLIEQGARRSVLWQRLAAEIKRKSDRARFSVLREGGVDSAAGFKIDYKVVDYSQSGSRTIQIYYLLTSQNRNYWVTATTVVVPELHATLSRTNLFVSLLRLDNLEER